MSIVLDRVIVCYYVLMIKGGCIELAYPQEASKEIRKWVSFPRLTWEIFQKFDDPSVKTIALNAELFRVSDSVYQFLEDRLNKFYAFSKKSKKSALLRLEDDRFKVDETVVGCIELERFKIKNIDNVVYQFDSWPYRSTSLAWLRGRNVCTSPEMSFLDFVTLCKAVTTISKARDTKRLSYGDKESPLFDLDRLNKQYMPIHYGILSRAEIEAPLVSVYDADSWLQMHCRSIVDQIADHSRLNVPDDEDDWLKIDDVLEPYFKDEPVEIIKFRQS